MSAKSRSNGRKGSVAQAAPSAMAAAPLSPEHARLVRILAITLAVTMLLWMFLNWAGSFYGWPVQLAFLFDIMAFSAFAWALFTAYRIWRDRSQERRALRLQAGRNTRI